MCEFQSTSIVLMTWLWFLGVGLTKIVHRKQAGLLGIVCCGYSADGGGVEGRGEAGY
jgi:hypothetical protein